VMLSSSLGYVTSQVRVWTVQMAVASSGVATRMSKPPDGSTSPV
jgi:hypothetical protein